MKELEKYELVNKCETAEQLAEAVLKIENGALIEGREKIFDAQRMSNAVH